MTFDELEQAVRELRDNQIVQGELLHRLEENMNERLDRLEQVVEKLADGMVVLQSAMTGMVQTVEGLAGDIRVLQSAMTGLVQSVEGLSATVERFIRGMEGNGHRPQSS